MSESMNLSFLSEQERISPSLDAVMELLERHEVEHKVLFKIRLVLEELLVNIVSYAYTPEKGNVEVNCEVVDDPKTLIIELKDSGKPFDPTAAEDPDLSAPIADRPIGGLGIFIVKKTMDEITYRRENDMNILVLKKFIKSN